MKIFIAVSLLSLIGVGCASCPEKAIIRDSMDEGTRTIRANEKAWAEKLVAYPVGTTDPRTQQPSDGKNKASEIKPLTPAQYSQEQKTQADYDSLVAQDRSSSSTTGPFSGLMQLLGGK